MMPMRVGLVSDSHGLFDPKLELLFAGCDLILHAGDVARPAVLESLRRIAPVRAVRGNNDLGPLADLPETLRVSLGDLQALLLHELGRPGSPSRAARRALARAPCQLVVHGHSHQPALEFLDGVLYVNPGSAGPRRFRLPRAAGILTVSGRHARVELRNLAGLELELLGDPVEVDL
jgi:putative phosphoesterase